MTTGLIRRNARADSCHHLTALMPRCTKTSFIFTPHYTCVHIHSDNLHNAVSIGGSGYKSKRRQIQNGDNQNGDNQNGDKSKTATNQNGDRPKRRHAKTATNQNGDTPKRRQPKRRHIQNGDMPKRRHIQNGDNQNGDHQNGACLSPFWRVAVLDTTKTATNPKRRQSNLSKTPC